MDLQMPVMDGFAATAMIRNELNSTIPIIALTADVTTVDLAKCKAVGMNDYLSKPVDEKLLYQKIVKHLILYKSQLKDWKSDLNVRNAVDLTYLKQLTKENPALMLEMISLFLEQTPKNVSAMTTGLNEKDWSSLRSAVHKLIPSFYIMGITNDLEKIARHIQHETTVQQSTDGMSGFVASLEHGCAQALEALEREYELIKNKSNEQE